ncbi:MAG: molybdopterin molybdotransferase MoeA [Mariprofundales bacterium]|nr:molybdopterin molybdotransferase MoeA [Mariprofundales bacterium]
MGDLSVVEAQRAVLQRLPVLGVERVALHGSLGRVLAADVAANRNHPPYDVSAMDGYAVRFADVVTQPVAPLQVVDDIRAGEMPQVAIERGQAARIMTGAPTPQGVDTVVRVEDTDLNGDQLSITSAPQQGDNIRQLGENLQRGRTVLQRGTLITPGVLAILAMVKQRDVAVFAQPTVAILATGDELEAIDEPVDESKIPNANSHALYAQCRSLGIEATLLGIARDSADDLRTKLELGLEYDLLLASGGVSVGHHDFVRPMMDALVVTIHFWRVAMRPGHPLAFGTADRSSGGGGVVVFGLPGNPVASMVCFEQFVAPALRKMMGHERIYRRTVPARLTHDIRGAAGRTLFVRVTLDRQGDEYVATSTGAQGSGVLMSMALADGLLVVPAGVEVLSAGEMGAVQLLQGMDFQLEAGC